MRKLLTLLVLCSGLAAASLAHAAAGNVSMSWDTCTPPVDATTANKQPGTAAASLLFSVQGSDETHNSYQVRFIMSAADRTTPDAWRFDADGCQTDAFIAINNFPPAAVAKSCPAFKGTGALEIKGFDNVIPSPQQPYLATQMRGLLAVTYAPATAVVGTRYFLGQFLFDHTFSVNGATTPGADCGGNDIPVCFALIQPTSYVRQSDGLEYPFTVNSGYLTYGTTPLAGCPATPSKAATWGQIKSQYRN